MYYEHDFAKGLEMRASMGTEAKKNIFELICAELPRRRVRNGVKNLFLRFFVSYIMNPDEKKNQKNPYG
jgi:hypothetical protein